MNQLSLIFKIAGRYLFSKKSTNAVNVLSGISMAGMGVGVMALVLVLSVFNGFESLVKQLHGVLDPEVRILPAEGKVFEFTQEDYDFMKSMREIQEISAVLEERVLVRYRGDEYLAMVRGVDTLYTAVSGIEAYMVQGNFELTHGTHPQAVLGNGIRRALNVNVERPMHQLSFYIPRREGRMTGISPDQAFRRASVLPTGSFSIQQEFDNQYIFVPIEFMQNALEHNVKTVSFLDIKVSPGFSPERVAGRLREALRDDYEIRTRYQLNETLYEVMRTEKWAVYAILTLILIIAAFNIIGSLSMLVLEKKHDIAILQAMGATPGMVRGIFLAEGILISIGGALIGALIAISVALLQIHFELIKLDGSGTFVISAYPVELRALDFLLISVTVIVIAIFASLVPAFRASRMKDLVRAE